MAYHSNGQHQGSNVKLGIGGSGNSPGAGGGGESFRGEYSGDERESRSGGEERAETDLHDKPIYLLEHLATFTVNKESGIVFPADGMRRLLQLEKTTGIWSQKMQLCLDYQWVLIMDYETGNIIERFPATLIQEPTAFTSTDAMELYNNILVFIVSGGNGERSEMHIFQSQNVSAVHLVEDLKNLRSGKVVVQQREFMQQQQQQQQHQQHRSNGLSKSMISTIMQGRSGSNEQQHHHQTQQHRSSNSMEQQYGARNAIDAIQQQHHLHGGGGGGHISVAGINGETDSEHGGGVQNDETSSTSSDKYERDVTVLNHCFDDIEKFIARLQHAAAATRELERRRRNRKSKKKDPGEGLLTLRTRPPHEKEFIDIFAKFKLSFNLLAKLKAHIHDPNAPELVHFLFTPLALIVEASSDTYYESQLPARVINPLLTREAINLLINCVTSKETELWRSLGDAWIIPRDQWKDDITSYHPVFLDGWSPDYLVVDELEPPTTPPNLNKRHLDIQQHSHSHSHQHTAEVLNGRGINSNSINTAATTAAAASAATAAAPHSGYDDYDTTAAMATFNDKYTVHHGHLAISERANERATNSGTGIAAAAADFSARSEISIDSIERTHPHHHHQHQHGGIGSNFQTQNAAMLQSITSGMQQLHSRDIRNTANTTTTTNSSAFGVGGGASAAAGDEQLLEVWLDDLQAAGAKIVLVTYPRTANNDKELSVVRGEYLEILDDSRKWWKARNIRGQIAHVPHTIVTSYNYDDSESRHQFYGQQQQQLQQQQQQPHNNYNKARLSPLNAKVDDNSEHRMTTESSDWIRNKHLDDNGDFMKMLTTTTKTTARVAVTVSLATTAAAASTTLSTVSANVYAQKFHIKELYHKEKILSPPPMRMSSALRSSQMYTSVPTTTTTIVQSPPPIPPPLPITLQAAAARRHTKASTTTNTATITNHVTNSKNIYSVINKLSDQTTSNVNNNNNNNNTNNNNYNTNNNKNTTFTASNINVEALPTTTTTNTTTTKNDTMQDELKHVLRLRERRGDLDIHKTPTIYITQNSSQREVSAWLQAKEFSSNIIKRLHGFNGEDLFALPTEKLEGLFGLAEGCKEARRLASQIQLQKSVSGYKTARSSELQAVLARARPKTEL